ncbi:MAG: NTP transferase domain-containing protein [Chloroflexi bacterium]|nr:NTP transferase domain-containing protein [Chloroflexota bacterium]
MERAIAMILAGGRGKRMDILCHERPKPALPFAGRFRVIDFSLSNCIHSEVKNIAILTDYQRSSMANYLKGWYSMNRIPESFEILEPKAGSYSGTANAVYQNLDYLREQRADKVLILAGDHIYKMDYRKMLAFHEQVKADVTVGVIPVPIEEAHRFGIVTTDSQHRIVDFTEKPKMPQSNLVSMGIYIFNREILAERLAEDAALPDSPHDFGYAIIPKTTKRDRVFAYKYDGYWQDIGTTKAYFEANIELTYRQPLYSLDGTWPLFTEGNDLPLPKKSQQGTIISSLVSPGCVIKGHVENSILSPGVWVDEKAVVRNSVLLSNAFVGYHSVVDHCILDEGATVGKFCYTGYGTSLNSGDITVIGRNVTVPPHTAVGRSCTIFPHIGAADFSTNVVPSGTVMSPQSSTLVKGGQR